MSDRSAVRIEPWGEDDLQLLERLMGDPEMTAHLGGPESPEKIAERQTRYERSDSGMFRIVDGATGEAVGSVGYWERTWHGEQVYEIGWSVIPAFQGRGIARMATAQAIAMARSARAAIARDRKSSTAMQVTLHRSHETATHSISSVGRSIGQNGTSYDPRPACRTEQSRFRRWA
jgi:ribosomal protein S18 acetylase RimI-like enzyme